MGGKEGNRGYLVQAIIALLDSLSDETWTSVSIEPDSDSEKVDIRWTAPARVRIAQVKSSINQIGKADAERWASELKGAACKANELTLILVGPCAQAVAEMGEFNGVKIPCPKSLDIPGMLNQAAHVLDKFLINEGLGRQSPSQRELIVNALTTELSKLSTDGKSLARCELVGLLKQWASGFCTSAASWERVEFASQRNIASAVAGVRLGPADVDACPEFSTAEEIRTELKRSHIHEVMGSPGCGKSITAWQVAKKFHADGFSIWRPRASQAPDQLLDDVPSRTPKLLLVDDAHNYGPAFAHRLAEISSSETKVLVLSTVTTPALARVFCISPERCVAELKSAVLARRSEILPIIRNHDDSVGDRYFESPFESRVHDAAKANTPWEFFWVLRGGWRSARREFESLKQFPHATDTMLIIAIGQIISCDAGVSDDWVIKKAQKIGLPAPAVRKAIQWLQDSRLIICLDTLRTNHLSYAYRVVEEGFRHTHFSSWRPVIDVFLSSVLDDHWSLRGVSWLLESVIRADAFRWRDGEAFQPVFQPLITWCKSECEEMGWAAGCLAKLFTGFDVSTEEILEHRDVVLRWIYSSPGIVSYFCGDILNQLINKSNRPDDATSRDTVRELFDSVDGSKLAIIANSLPIDEYRSFGYLLNRLSYFGPVWASRFLESFDWARCKKVIAETATEHGFAFDQFITTVARLASIEDESKGLDYVAEVAPYISKSINENPIDGTNNWQDVFWLCLGYAPKFLRGGESPDDNQVRVAKKIVAALDAEAFATATKSVISRDLEKLARTFEVIYEIDRGFLREIASRISEEEFFTCTADDWREQSEELRDFLRFFCTDKQHEPAASWIRKNRERIEGPVHTLFVCIAPDVAMEFYQKGLGVKIVEAGDPRWKETSLAIRSLARIDQAACIEIVEQQLEVLEDAVYKLSLGSLKGLLYFFVILEELSNPLFNQFMDRLDLNKPAARKTIKQLATNQPKEMAEYRKVAKVATRYGGRGGVFASEFLRRLKAAVDESQEPGQ